MALVRFLSVSVFPEQLSRSSKKLMPSYILPLPLHREILTQTFSGIGYVSEVASAENNRTTENRWIDG